MKKILNIALISFCLFNLSACATIVSTLPIVNNAVNKNNNETNTTNNSIFSINNNSYEIEINQNYMQNEKDGRVYLKTEYPYISLIGLDDNTSLHDTINTINKNQEKEANDFMENTNDSAIAALFESDMYEGTMYFTQESKMNIERKDNKLLVLSNQIYYDAGGAHPSTNSVFTNIYIPTGKELKIDDVVVDKNSFYDTLKTELKKQNPDFGFFDDWEDNIEIYKKGYFDLGEVDEELRYPVTLNFMLLDGKLNVYFNPYDLGPYASGGIGVNLPYDEFKDIVKDEYK